MHYDLNAADQQNSGLQQALASQPQLRRYYTEAKVYNFIGMVCFPYAKTI
jgi:hypothetical protein